MWSVVSNDPQVTFAGKEMAIIVEQELGIVLIALVERLAGSADAWQTAVMIDPNWSMASMQNGDGGWMGWVNRLIDKVNGYMATLNGIPPP